MHVLDRFTIRHVVRICVREILVVFMENLTHAQTVPRPFLLKGPEDKAMEADNITPSRYKLQ